MDSSNLSEAVERMKSIWNEQSRTNKYLAIIAITIPSCIALRECAWFMYRKYYSLPPGPSGLPIFGIFFQWIKGNYASRIALGKRYPQIFYSTMLSMPVITLSSSKLVKQLLIQKNFFNRFSIIDPKNDYYHSIGTHGKSCALDLILENGEKWSRRRKLVQDTLIKVLNRENAGNLLKQTMEQNVKPYLDEIMKSNKPWYTNDIFRYITFNTIYSTIFGENLGRDSDFFRKIIKSIHAQSDNVNLSMAAQKVPFVHYFLSKRLDKIKDFRHDLLQGLIQQAIKDKDKRAEKTFFDYIHEDNKYNIDEEMADLNVLFTAGSDTTTSTLDFGVALLAKYQGVQDKIRKELLNVMGDNKEFSFKLMNKCPLFRACIHEIMRISSVVFQGVFRMGSKDYWITLDDGKKYRIPAWATIQTNLDYIQIDGGGKDEHWKRTNGDEIILENFLKKDEDGGVRFVLNESFIPFGVGKRDCAGRQLAMKEIYYVLGYLLMNYKLLFMNEDDKNKDILSQRVNDFAVTFLGNPSPIKLISMDFPVF